MTPPRPHRAFTTAIARKRSVEIIFSARIGVNIDRSQGTKKT